MMSSRERVLLAIDRKEPDRVPLGSPQGVVNVNDAVKKFLKEFDFDHVIRLNFLKSPDERRKVSDGICVDDFGCIFMHKGVENVPYCIHNPLRDARKVEDIERFRWPDPNDPSLLKKDAYENAKKICKGEREYVTAVGVGEIFHTYARLRGFDKWLMDMKINPEVYEVIASKIYNIRLRMTMRVLEEVGDYVDLIRMGDDMGSTNAPFMSVEDFRRFVKPYYKNLITRIKKRIP